MERNYHIPVLLEESVGLLGVESSGTYVDLTFGGGGHSRRILSMLGPEGRLYGFDQDSDTSGNVPLDSRFHYVESNFRFLRGALRLRGVAGVDGILADLGVSSHHFDAVERGFSFRGSAPLDMRMSQTGPTAADLVATLPREELARILNEYGEEPNAWQIAGRIVREREREPIETTGRLASIVAGAVPSAVRRKAKNPARRTFQALRIAVNGELDALSEGMDAIFAALRPGGRFCIITFHSLEDRLVKQRFKQRATACTCPPEFPVCVCGGKAKARLVTRKPIEPSAAEQEENRRARSAKLRIVEKL